MPATAKFARDKWITSPFNPELSEFLHNHWGARGRALLNEVLQRPPLERFLDVSPRSALQRLGMSIGLDSTLFVREETLLFAQRFLNARGLGEQAIEGVVLLGQAGIGKTSLLVFFLIQCLSQEEPVLFTTRCGSTYLFDERGVASILSSRFVASQHLPYHLGRHGAPRLWSLVDGLVAPVRSPLSVTLDARPQVFFIAALSPHTSHYKPFENDLSTVRTWWMSRWSNAELQALLRRIVPPAILHDSHRERYRTFSRCAIRSLRAAAGPVPRDILKFLGDPCGYAFILAQEVGYHSLPPILALLSGTEAFSNESYDYVTFVGPAPSPAPALSPAELGDDAYALGFKTRAAERTLLDALERRGAVRHLKALYARCAQIQTLTPTQTQPQPQTQTQSRPTVPGPGPGLAGFLFEGLARQYTHAAFDFGIESVFCPPDGPDAVSAAGGPAGVRALSRLVGSLPGFSPSPSPGEGGSGYQFARMALLAPASADSGTQTTARFVHCQAGARTTVAVDKDRRITWRSSLPPPPAQGISPHETQVASPPWAARPRVPFASAAQPALDGASCYCPTAPPLPTSPPSSPFLSSPRSPPSPPSSHPPCSPFPPSSAAPIATPPCAAFDAFFFQVCWDPRPARIVLWAVQFARTRCEDDVDEGEGEDADAEGKGSCSCSCSCSCSDDAGFATVAQLRARVRDMLPGAAVDVKYALVVPCDSRFDPTRGSAFDVEWELGAGFGAHDVEGEVYVQFLDVCGVCRVEDVFGVPALVPVYVPRIEDCERSRGGRY